MHWKSYLAVIQSLRFFSSSDVSAESGHILQSSVVLPLTLFDKVDFGILFYLSLTDWSEYVWIGLHFGTQKVHCICLCATNEYVGTFLPINEHLYLYLFIFWIVVTLCFW